MERFAGIKNGNIQVISEKTFASAVKVPSELDNVSAEDLILSYRVSNDVFKNKNAIIPIDELKIAFVSNWKMRCGIARYAEMIYPELVKYVHDIKIFAEIGINDGYEENVIRCWERGESIMDLVRAIKEYDPD